MAIDYRALAQRLLNEGERVESRIGWSRELMGQQVTLEPGDLVWRPGFSKALGWMELLQLIAGIYDVDQIRRVAPRASMDLFSTTSAYGPRMYKLAHKCRPTEPPDPEEYTHFHHVIRELWASKNSRRAVLFIGKDENLADELSCTLTYQMLLRAGFLHVEVNMRSWDLIRGLPYDIVMFGGLQLAICHMLRVQPGSLRVTAGSLHLYESDLEMIPKQNMTSRFFLELTKSDDFSWPGLRMICKNQVYNDWGESKTPHFIRMNEWQPL